eukprot:COSAG01_NODE_983_length_12354_cov_2.780335_6_plen_59_part_00
MELLFEPEPSEVVPSFGLSADGLSWTLRYPPDGDVYVDGVAAAAAAAAAADDDDKKSR